MAVLEKIRERTVSILVVIGVALFAFVVSPEDLLRFFNNNSNIEVFVSVNGEELDQEKYNEYLTNLKIQNSEEVSHKSVWESLVNEKLISSAASDLNLIITPQEIKELVTGYINPKNVSPYFRKRIEDAYKNSIEENRKNPDYPIDTLFTDQFGSFSGDKVEVFLADRSQWPSEREKGWSQLEEEISQQRLPKKYKTLIEKGMYTTNSEVITTLNERDQNAEVKYVSIPYSSFEVKIDSQEILDYYDKNISDYQNKEESRDIEYVTFTIAPSTEDDMEIKQKMIIISNNDSLLDASCEVTEYQKLSEINKDPIFSELIKKEVGTVVGPYLEDGAYRIAKFSESTLRSDSVKASHILLNIDEGDTITSLSNLIDFAEDLKKQVKDGSDFGQLALQFSKDKGTANKGGDLDWFTESQMISEFAEACFTSKRGDLKIVTTQYGVHLIKIDSITNLIPKYKIAYFDKEVVASQETQEDYFWDAKKFRDLAYDQVFIQTSSESKNKILQYWWILLDIGIIFVLLYFLYIKKKDIRRFVPYVVLFVLLVAGSGIYFDSEIKELRTLKSDNTFESLSDSLNVRYDYADDIHNMKFSIKDLQNSREIVKWMFDVNTKVGDVSNKTYRCGNDFLVVSLSAINPKGDKTLESVRDIIIQEIQNDKKFDNISLELSKSPTLEEASSLSDSDTVYTASLVNFASKNINGILDTLSVHNFVGAVNALDEGKTSRLIKGNNAAYLIDIVSKGSITENTEDKKDKIRQENSFGAYYEALKILKENSDIVDNRSIFY